MPKFDLETALDRADLNPGQTPARLLREAESLFARRGFEGVRMRDVAGGAGVNISTLHFHWKDKGTLYEAVCRWHARLLRDAVRRAAEELPSQVRLDQRQVESWIDQMVLLLTDHPAIAPLALQSVSDQTPPELPSLFRHDLALFRRAAQEVGKRMRGGKNDSSFLVLTVFYFVIVAFGDSSLQRAVLGGSILREPELQDRFKRFLSRLLMSLLDG